MDVAVVFFSEFSAAKSAVWRLYKWIKRGSHGSYIKANSNQTQTSVTCVAVFHMQISWSDMNDETGIDNKLSFFEVVLLNVWWKVPSQECGEDNEIREVLQSVAIFTDFLRKCSGQSDRNIKNFCQCLCKYLMFSHVIVLQYNEISQISH